jgi:hypothetical protein
MSEIIEGLLNIAKSGLIVLSRKLKKLSPKKNSHHHQNHH